MLAGIDIAKVSAYSGVTITANSESYTIPKGEKSYTFWDTSGLNEGDKGSVPAQEADEELINLLKGMNVSLIIYLTRGHRFMNEVVSTKHMFDRIRSVCGEKVPIVLVVTGLEQWEVMDEWWTSNRSNIKGLKLSFQGHACVTTIKGRNNIYETEYQESRNKVWKLVEEHCKPSVWKLAEGPSVWFLLR